MVAVDEQQINNVAKIMVSIAGKYATIFFSILLFPPDGLGIFPVSA
jgi:hypothetical protein